MKKYSKIIFVCLGNTCRSPIAATILNGLKGDREILVSSRGMVVLFPEPYNPKAVAVSSSHGMIMPSNSARELEEADFGNDTLVLTMTADIKQKIYAEFENPINVYTLQEYAGVEETEAVMDPYGKGIDEYSRCFEQLYVLVSKVAKNLFEEEKN